MAGSLQRVDKSGGTCGPYRLTDLPQGLSSDSLDVGGVMINQAPTWRSDTMPYGGVKQSGFGREGIRYAMQDMTEPRTLVIKG